jgi:hypothetical protein
MAGMRSAADMRLRLRVYRMWLPHRLRYRQWGALRKHFALIFRES